MSPIFALFSDLAAARMVLADARESGRSREDISALAKEFRAVWRAAMGEDRGRTRRFRPLRWGWSEISISVDPDPRLRRMWFRREFEKKLIRQDLHPRSVEFEAARAIEMETYDALVRLKNDMFTAVYQVLASSDKIPYSAGFSMLQTEIAGGLEVGWRSVDVVIDGDAPEDQTISVKAIAPGVIQNVTVVGQLSF